MADPSFGFTVPGPPVPLQRARVTSRGTYLPSKSRTYRATLRAAAGAARPLWWDTGRTVTLELDVFWPDKRRRDLSNVLKAVEDALQETSKQPAILWDDDWQIQTARIYGHIDRDNPRLEVFCAYHSDDPCEH